MKLEEHMAARTVTVSLTELPDRAVPMLNCTDPFPAPSVVPVYVNVTPELASPTTAKAQMSAPFGNMARALETSCGRAGALP